MSQGQEDKNKIHYSPIQADNAYRRTCTLSTVVFFNYLAYAHIASTLPLVRELVHRGERVIYYALEDFQAAIEDTGATFHSYGQDFPSHLTNAELDTAMTVHGLLQASQWVLDNLLQEVRSN